MRDPGRAVGMAAEEDVWMARREAATVAWVRRTETGCEEACARSLPWEVVRRRVGRWAVWWEWRKVLSRLVRRRGGVALGTDMMATVGGFFDGRGFCEFSWLPALLEMFRVVKARREPSPQREGRKKLMREKTRNEARKPAGRDARHGPFALARSLACSRPFALPGPVGA